MMGSSFVFILPVVTLEACQLIATANIVYVNIITSAFETNNLEFFEVDHCFLLTKYNHRMHLTKNRQVMLEPLNRLCPLHHFKLVRFNAEFFAVVADNGNSPVTVYQAVKLFTI